jgi:hypothetical protein
LHYIVGKAPAAPHIRVSLIMTLLRITFDRFPVGAHLESQV